MTKPTYTWSWRRSRGKSFLELIVDGNRVGLIKVTMASDEKMQAHLDKYHFCSCGPEYNCDGPTYKEAYAAGPRAYHVYFGGKFLGTEHEMVDAKLLLGGVYQKLTPKKTVLV